MHSFRRLSPVSAIFILSFVSLAILSVAQGAQQATVAQQTKVAQQAKTAKCSIKNFGCVNETFYRGAQPKERDFADLAAMGVKTVIDLQMGGMEREQALVEAQGMKFYRIGMSDKNQPAAEQVDLFLKLVNDPANQPVFIHCAGGRHRTGAMSAVYRMTHDGWTADQAFNEMRQYDFDYGMGHTPLKNYVFSYFTNIEQKGVLVKTSSN